MQLWKFKVIFICLKPDSINYLCLLTLKRCLMNITSYEAEFVFRNEKVRNVGVTPIPGPVSATSCSHYQTHCFSPGRRV